jgi:AraC-like DNA-binding protein
MAPTQRPRGARRWFVPFNRHVDSVTRTSVEDPALAALRAQLVARVTRLVPQRGQHEWPALPGLHVYRSDELEGTVCGVYEPCIALILQGSKRAVLGDDAFVYDTRRYLIASLDLPALATILEASPQQPYLALVLRVDLREIANLLLSGAVLPRVPPPSARDARAMATGAVTLPLLEAFRRLLDLLDQPADAAVLAPLVRREIFYRLLVGEGGARLREIASIDSQGHQIARAIDRLKSRFAEPLPVEVLAREVRMSVSTFHHHFKALTAMSPLQYQKRLRLTEARRLMLAENLDASSAAYRVGYESASQFSREYSRQFGAPPTRDIAGLRVLPQPVEGAEHRSASAAAIAGAAQ